MRTRNRNIVFVPLNSGGAVRHQRDTAALAEGGRPTRGEERFVRRRILDYVGRRLRAGATVGCRGDCVVAAAGDNSGRVGLTGDLAAVVVPLVRCRAG